MNTIQLNLYDTFVSIINRNVQFYKTSKELATICPAQGFEASAAKAKAWVFNEVLNFISMNQIA